jgi:hypothetical protein
MAHAQRFIGKVECVERLEDKQRVTRNVQSGVMRVYPVQRGLRPSDVRSGVLELDRQWLDELDLGEVVAVEDARQSNGDVVVGRHAHAGGCSDAVLEPHLLFFQLELIRGQRRPLWRLPRLLRSCSAPGTE